MTLGARFDAALLYAAELHRDDARKGPKRIPYVSHLLAVASLVIEDGGSEDEAVAALLHDAAEDHGHEQLDVIRDEFGGPVADIVATCTDTIVAPKEDWERRKRRYLEHLRSVKARPALRVSLADKLHNARAIFHDYRGVGEALWERFQRGPEPQLWYYQSLARLFHEVRPGAMADELIEAVAELGRLVSEAQPEDMPKRHPECWDPDTRVMAVDWSGRERGAQEHIWVAEAQRGFLLRLENGRDRDAVIDHAIAHGQRYPRLVVGFDFAFSFPEWFARERLKAQSGREVWRAVDDQAESWLSDPPPPFWAKGGVKRPPGDDTRHFRITERTAGGAAKSVFQLAGGGHVGSGSLRGMPHLLRLADAGFSIWPFCKPDWPRAVEIYPAVFSKPTRKSQRAARALSLESEGFVPAVLRERAAGRQDAFDAAVSALAMSRHVHELEDLPRKDDVARIEGEIWRPMHQ